MVGPYINLKYTLKSTTEGNGGIFTGDTQLFLYKPMTLTAYYPFKGTEGTAPGIDGVITASTTLDYQTKETQPEIDFLWDSKTGVDNTDFSAADPNVNFEFTHRMSKLSFTFKGSHPVYDEKNENHMVSDGVDVRTMVEYRIDGLGIEGTFNTATGVCAIDDTKDRQTLTIFFDDEPIEGDMNYDYERPFPSLIVFPQEKPEKGFILHIRTKELKEDHPYQEYKCSLGFTNNEIKPGYHYNFSIQVTRRGLIVGDLTIEPWVGSQRFIVATIDGEEDPKEIPAENP